MPIFTASSISTNAPVPTEFPQQTHLATLYNLATISGNFVFRFHNYPWAGEWQLGGPWLGLSPDDYNVDGPVG